VLVKLDQDKYQEIERRIDLEIETRKTRMNPAANVRPVFLSCLENLSNVRLIAGVLDEPVEVIEAFVAKKSEERFMIKLGMLQTRLQLLPVKPGLRREFEETTALNIDTNEPDWIAGAHMVEALLEIGEALAARAESELIARICDRMLTDMTARKTAIVFSWLEVYIPEGKEFVAWYKLYKEEQKTPRAV
jgi:hypothetical protein